MQTEDVEMLLSDVQMGLALKLILQRTRDEAYLSGIMWEKEHSILHKEWNDFVTAIGHAEVTEEEFLSAQELLKTLSKRKFFIELQLSIAAKKLTEAREGRGFAI